MSFVKDLDAPLLRLSAHGDVLTPRHAAGIHFWMAIGGGKTTSAQMDFYYLIQ
jgi:hypothetical protein